MKSQSSELSGYCAGTFDFVQSYEMKYESENPLSGVTLGFFLRKSRRSRDERDERFHQDIMAKEKRHQCKWTLSMLANYCWTVKTDVPDAKYRRKSYASTF